MTVPIMDGVSTSHQPLRIYSAVLRQRAKNLIFIHANNYYVYWSR
jgi:hypothetical protein